MNYHKDIQFIKQLLANGKNDLARDLMEKIYQNNKKDYFLENFYGAFLALNGDEKQQDLAIIKFKNSILLNDKFSEAYYNLSCILFKKEQFLNCEEYLKVSLLLEPENIDYKNLLGLNYIKLKKFNDAIKLFNLVLKNQLDNVDAYFGLGIIYTQLGELHKAIFFLEKAIDLNINRVEAYIELSNCYSKTNANFFANLKLTSKGINLFKSSSLYILHAKNLSQFSKMDEAFLYFEKAIELEPDNLRNYHSHLFYLNYKSNLDFNYYLETAKKFENKYLFLNKFEKYENNLKLIQKIKIGFVSYDFRDHALMYQIFNVIKELYKNNDFVIYGYYSHSIEDEVTLKIKEYFHSWVNISQMNDTEATNRIRSDEVFILFDLGGYTTGNRIGIFIQRAAPNQISWAGYLNTTGLNNIDYIVTDFMVIKDNFKNNYKEKIIALPDLWTVLSDFKMPNIDEVSITTPALKNNYITFGCFANINKINKDVFNLIIKILETIPNSRIIFQSENFGDLDFKKYFLNIFTLQSIDKNRLTFFGHFLSRHDFLLKFNEIDIVIDTFPYNGHTTNLEAAWMCVPVLTKNGDNFLSRCGVSINSILNLDELIYENDDDCLLKLKNLNDNYKNIQLIKEKIIKRKKTSLIFDYKKFTNNLSKEIYKIVEQKR